MTVICEDIFAPAYISRSNVSVSWDRGVTMSLNNWYQYTHRRHQSIIPQTWWIKNSL